MARYFDGSSYITLADHSALTMNTWSLGFWFRKGPMATSGTRYLISWGLYSATPSLNMFIYGDENENPGQMLCRAEDSSGTSKASTLTTTITDANWHHIVLTYDGSNAFRAYIDGVLDYSSDIWTGLGEIDLAEPLQLGCYNTLGNKITGDMAEWAKWDVVLSVDEVESLAAGIRPVDIGKRPAWYVPMLGSLYEEIEDIATTNTGTTIVEHPSSITTASHGLFVDYTKTPKRPLIVEDGKIQQLLASDSLDIPHPSLDGVCDYGSTTYQIITAGGFITNGSITTGNLDIGDYSLPNTAGTEGYVLTMGANDAEWAALDIEGNAYNKTGWDPSVFSEVTITFTDGTMTVAIAPVGDSASYYIDGTKYTFTTEQSVAIDDTEGLWYIYFDGDTLTASQTPWTFNDTQCEVALLYWDATNNVNIGWEPELHSWILQDNLHGYLHDTIKTRYADGLGVAEATTSTINVATGYIYDEDIRAHITDEAGSGWWDQVLSPLTAPIYYRSGAGVWRKLAASTSLCYLDTNVPQINIYSGTWQWDAVDPNRYFAYWVVASTGYDYPVFLVPGQEAADNLSDTLAGNLLTDMDFGGLPTEEHKVIARLILRRTGDSPYYEITQIDDYRYAQDITAGAGTTVSDHGGLTGLLDDDHTQYHNDTRAATWIDSGFTTNGNIVLANDSVQVVLGAGSDYSIEWDGANAAHTVNSGQFNFVGGAVSCANGFAGDLTGTADNVVTNANMTGEVTSIGNATTLDPTSISGKADTTIVAADYLLFWDATDSTLKKVDAGELLGASSDDLDDVCDRGATTDQTIIAGGFTTTGSIKNNADSSKHYFGAGDDMYIEHDGANGNFVITEGSFNFSGGPISVPSVNTTVRDALTPVNGMSLYNSTDEQFQSYENSEWVHKANTLASGINFYVATTGNDATGDGSAGTPWATIDKAWAVANSHVPLGEININIEAGSYAATDTLVLDGINGRSINILGDYNTDTLALASTSGVSGNRLFTFNTANTSYYTVNNYVLIHTATGGTNASYALGTFKVSSLVAGVSVTLQTPSTVAPSGAVSATVSIPGVKFIRKIELKRPVRLIRGIYTELAITTSNVDPLLYISTMPGVSASFQHCVWYNSGTARYGALEIRKYNSTFFEYCGTRNMGVGWSAFAGIVYADRCGATDCLYGFYSAYEAPIGLDDVHLLVCGTGLAAYYIGLIYKNGVAPIFVGCTTNSNPVNGVEGNINSIITY